MNRPAVRGRWERASEARQPFPGLDRERSAPREIGRALFARRRIAVTFEADDYDLEGFLSVAASFGTRRYGYVATPNVDGLIRLRESPSFREAYGHAAYVLLDSRVASLAFRVVHRVRVPVCTGSDLTAALLEHVIRSDDRVVLVGAAEAQAQMLRERYGLAQLLHHNPPMGFIGDSAAVERCLQFVEAASPFRFCLIAVGDPQGSILAHRLAARQRALGLAFIVGASIDFITGRQRRAPAWMQRIALEWLYRLAGDPRRLARRYLVRGPKFFGYLRSIEVVLRQAVDGCRSRYAGRALVQRCNEARGLPGRQRACGAHIAAVRVRPVECRDARPAAAVAAGRERMRLDRAH